MDYIGQMEVLEYWSIPITGKSKYLAEYNSSDIAALVAKPPRIVGVLHNVVLFFLNHGISEKVYQDLQLIKVPKSDRRRFRNSANWADYILSLPKGEQERVLQYVSVHYEKEAA